MRTTEQTHWQWATRGVGGVVNILRFLVEDGIPPSPETLKMLMGVHTDLTDVIEQGEKLHRTNTGEQTTFAQQAIDNERRLAEQSGRDRPFAAGEQVRTVGDADKAAGGSTGIGNA